VRNASGLFERGVAGALPGPLMVTICRAAIFTPARSHRHAKSLWGTDQTASEFGTLVLRVLIKRPNCSGTAYAVSGR
jgi:hypothetical protein